MVTCGLIVSVGLRLREMSIILALLLMTNEIQGEMPMKDIITTTNALLNLFKTFTNIPTLEIGVE